MIGEASGWVWRVGPLKTHGFEYLVFSWNGTPMVNEAVCVLIHCMCDDARKIEKKSTS